MWTATTLKEAISMGFISMVGVGLVVGAIAKMVMPGKDPGGSIVAIVLAIAGSILAGFFGHAVGWYEAGLGAGVFASFVGAAVILTIYGVVVGRRAGRRDRGARPEDIKRAA
jgi:uncharacterized membrane protein YeaQ/YmgE (transglycosylase-associated protein family)